MGDFPREYERPALRLPVPPPDWMRPMHPPEPQEEEDSRGTVIIIPMWDGEDDD